MIKEGLIPANPCIPTTPTVLEREIEQISNTFAFGKHEPEVKH